MCAVNFSLIRLGFAASAADRDHELKIRKPSSPTYSCMWLARCSGLMSQTVKYKSHFCWNNLKFQQGLGLTSSYTAHSASFLGLIIVHDHSEGVFKDYRHNVT